jgi:hypothetical protein
MNASGNDEKSRPNAFPESELPKWLLRQLRILRRRAAAAVRGPEYKLLAQFSNDLRTCTGSSLDIARGLELCIKPIRKTRIGERLRGAADQVRRGSTLADALSPAEDLLPPFFLPVIRVGEQSGRLTDALSFLESHCSLLAGPASAVRNVCAAENLDLLGGSNARLASSSVTKSRSRYLFDRGVPVLENLADSAARIIRPTFE